MYKKKLSTIAIITILTLSTLLAAMPMALAAPPIGVPTLSATSGNVGDKITVSDATGTATAFGIVEVYWDTLATKIKDGYADSAGDYSIANVVIPEDVAGAHEVIVYDTLSSTINSATFTILPEIDLSTTKVLPGDSVTVDGTGFGDEVDVGIGLGAEVAETGEAVGTGDGSTKAFPLDYSPVKPGSETITAPGVGQATFTTVGTTTAPTTITVTAPTVTADFYASLWDGLDTTELVAPVASTGDDSTADTLVLTYAYAASTAYIVKITAADETGSYTLADNGAPAGSGGPIVISTYTYTITTEYTINYGTGVVTFVTAPVLGETISADYTRYTYGVTPVVGVTTSDVGSFSAAILIPAIPETAYGAFDVTAVDEDGNSDTATLTVDYYVKVTPSSGPTGITITISGRIEANKAYELRFNAAPVATGTTGADGLFSDTYVIPSVLSVGTYNVDVVWEITKIKTATFQVKAPPTITLGATSGVAGAVVTISGADFSGSANITLYFDTTVVNSTALDSRFGPTGFTGSFSEDFTVPALAAGVYAVKVTDQYGASTAPIYTFIVSPTPVVTIALRASSYYPGDTLSFTIVTTEPDLGTITVTVKDPSGATWWTTALWALTITPPTKSVLYQDQVIANNPLTLPADAPLGSWTWTVKYTPVSTGVLTTASGVFTVAALPSMQTVLDQLDTMEASIKSVVTTSEGKIIAVINTKAGEIIADLSALDAKIISIDGDLVTISTSIGEVQTDLAALDLGTMGVDITAIKGDVATIKTNLGTVTTSVSGLSAKVTSISGDVATVSTTLGTLTGKVTSIEGSVATIETDVGTVQADISTIQDDVAAIDVDVDMTPAWIAVVLSLVAAIAAIFAVITIRQKIAG
jgi:archaellum component FlaC